MLVAVVICFLAISVSPSQQQQQQQDELDRIVDTILQQYPEISGLIYSWTVSALSGNSRLSQNIQGRLFSSLIGLGNDNNGQSDPIILGPDLSDSGVQQAATLFDSISQLDRFQCLPRLLCSAAATLIAPPTTLSTPAPIVTPTPPPIVLPPAPPVGAVVRPPAPPGNFVSPPSPPINSGFVAPPNPTFTGSTGAGGIGRPPAPPSLVLPPGVSSSFVPQPPSGLFGSSQVARPPGIFSGSSPGLSVAVGPPAPLGFQQSSTPGPTASFNDVPIQSSPVFAEQPFAPQRPLRNRLFNPLSSGRSSVSFPGYYRNSRSEQSPFSKVLFPETQFRSQRPHFGVKRPLFTELRSRSFIQDRNGRVYSNESLPATEAHRFSPSHTLSSSISRISSTTPIFHGRQSRFHGNNNRRQSSRLGRIRFPQRKRRRKRFVQSVNSVLSVLDSVTRPYSFHPLTHAVLMGGMHESRPVCARLYWRCPTTRDQMLDVVNNLNAYFPSGSPSLLPNIKIPALDAFIG